MLEVMRQPLEERRVTIARAKVSIEFPANFMLIASMNPCPCGYYNHPDKECVCGAGRGAEVPEQSIRARCSTALTCTWR
ncbi:MAG: ATP-binding protein [Hymenobacter sp.]